MDAALWRSGHQGAGQIACRLSFQRIFGDARSGTGSCAALFTIWVLLAVTAGWFVATLAAFSARR